MEGDYFSVAVQIGTRAFADLGPSKHDHARFRMDAKEFTDAVVILLIYLAVLAFYTAAGWKVFAKAGEPGWGIFVPIYNLYLVCKISGRPEWWLILFFIPLVNVVIGLIIAMDIAKAFSKSSGFGIDLWLLSFIFVPILGFRSAQYTQPSALPRI